MNSKIKLPGVIYEMTTVCNLKCKYCYNYWKKNNEKLTQKQQISPKKTIKQYMKNVKCKQVVFSRRRTNNKF